MLLCRPIVRAVVAGGEASRELSFQQLEPLWILLLSHLIKHAGVYEEEVRRLHDVWFKGLGFIEVIWVGFLGLYPKPKIRYLSGF